MKQLKIHIGGTGTLSTIELEVPGLNTLRPANANVAVNAKGRPVSAGTYYLWGNPAEVGPDLQSGLGAYILRFQRDDENDVIAILAGSLAQDGSIKPVEGSAVRVSDDVMAELIAFLDGDDEVELVISEEDLGTVTSIRSKWHGQPANDRRIRFIRPVRYHEQSISSGFYNDYYDDDISDWLAWWLYCELLDSGEVDDVEFTVRDDGQWQGFAGGESGGGGSSDSWGDPLPQGSNIVQVLEERGDDRFGQDTIIETDVQQGDGRFGARTLIDVQPVPQGEEVLVPVFFDARAEVAIEPDESSATLDGLADTDSTDEVTGYTS